MSTRLHRGMLKTTQNTKYRILAGNEAKVETSVKLQDYWLLSLDLPPIPLFRNSNNDSVVNKVAVGGKCSLAPALLASKEVRRRNAHQRDLGERGKDVPDRETPAVFAVFDPPIPEKRVFF